MFMLSYWAEQAPQQPGVKMFDIDMLLDQLPVEQQLRAAVPRSAMMVLKGLTRCMSKLRAGQGRTHFIKPGKD